MPGILHCSTVRSSVVRVLVDPVLMNGHWGTTFSSPSARTASSARRASAEPTPLPSTSTSVWVKTMAPGRRRYSEIPHSSPSIHASNRLSARVVAHLDAHARQPSRAALRVSAQRPQPHRVRPVYAYVATYPAVAFTVRTLGIWRLDARSCRARPLAAVGRRARRLGARRMHRPGGLRTRQRRGPRVPGAGGCAGQGHHQAPSRPAHHEASPSRAEPGRASRRWYRPRRACDARRQGPRPDDRLRPRRSSDRRGSTPTATVATPATTSSRRDLAEHAFKPGTGDCVVLTGVLWPTRTPDHASTSCAADDVLGRHRPRRRPRQRLGLGAPRGGTSASAPPWRTTRSTCSPPTRAPTAPRATATPPPGCRPTGVTAAPTSPARSA